MNEIGRVAAECLETAAQYGEVIIITNSDDGWVKYSAERYVPNLLPILPKYRIVSARTAYEQYYPGQPLCWKAAAFAHEVNEFYCQLENELKMQQQMSSGGGGIEVDMDGIVTSNRSDVGFENQPPELPDSMVSTDDSSDDSEVMMHHHHSKRSPRSSSKRKSSSPPSSSTMPIRREVISFGDSMEERTAVKIVSSQLTALPKSVMFLSSPSPEQLIGQLVMLTGHMKYVCEQKHSLDLEISPHQAEKMAASILNKRKDNSKSTSSTKQPQHHRNNNNSRERSPMEVLSFHEENVRHPHETHSHNHPMHHYDNAHHQVHPHHTSNTMPRMRRAGTSDNAYDETFSL